ncbi:MAG: hypothetical protein JWP12_2807 [Bacteroidetes bacterium]|nr:hypothetical protein [Bacteroidota bacterium]
MDVYCIQEFKSIVEKLKKNKPYNEIEQDTIDYFFGKTIAEISSGANLNNNPSSPYIKKRLSGRGGFRVYYLLLVKDDKTYLIYIHPKTGPEGSPNLTETAKTEFYKKVLQAIESNDLYKLSCNAKKTELIFEKVEKSVKK